MASMKVANLSDIGQAFIMLTCKKENEMKLLSDWSKMLADYPILQDLWSDVVVAQGRALESIETLDKRGMPALAQSSPTREIDRFVIFVCKEYFARKSFDQKNAILLHELGHFYVYKKGLLEKLRQDWKKGEDLFRVFVAPFEKQNSKHIDSYRDWLKRFYINYIFDLLKIPGEYYASLWVKENFRDVFADFLDSEYQGYKSLFDAGFSAIQKGLVKFVLFSLILRLSVLILLINDKNNLERFKRLKENCWSELEEYTTNAGFSFLKSFEDKIIKLGTSPESANEHLIEALEEYINNFPVKLDVSKR